MAQALASEPDPQAPPLYGGPGGLTPAAIARVRPKVQAMLTGIPAFAMLSSAEQSKLANDMVKVLAYIDDPAGVVEDTALGAPPPANRATTASATKAMAAPVRGLADANEQTRQNLSKSPGFAGKDFVAGAAAQGTEQFTNLVHNVDFPAFVGGLINNVFKSIVETTIEQMRAYAELISAVAKTAEEYMAENIGMGQGRDYMVDRFPDLLAIDVDEDSGKSKLRVTGEDEESALAEIHSTLAMAGPAPTDLSEDEVEAGFVNAARIVMAKSRQQLLASMVMLGINRIVVTDGSITAKVKFDMRATDQAKRDYRASAYDRQSSRNRKVSAFGGSFLGFGGGQVSTSEQSHVATVSTAVNETSESQLELAAKMQGEVRVNFKSDYLPLEKMASPEMIGAIQGNSVPPPPRGAARPATPAAATPNPAPAGP